MNRITNEQREGIVRRAVAERDAILWTRADPQALAAFDPTTKVCTMNCGPAGGDPRSHAERKLLCDDCLPAPERRRDVAGILHFLTPQQMAEEIVRLDAVIAGRQPNITMGRVPHGVKASGDSRAAMQKALEALTEVRDLIGESQGVYGLHLNGDPSPWDELEAGGRFERLTSLDEAAEALRGTLGMATPSLDQPK